MIKRLRALLGRETPAPEQPHTRVLMVCMGNICRSPTAEAVLRAKLERAGLAGQVLVDSAGTHGYHTGEPPDPRAIAAGQRRGYTLQGLRARPVQPEDFERFDCLLAMDQANLEWLQRKAPQGHRAALRLLLSSAPQLGEAEVPDPYYGPAQGFERVLDLVEGACEALLQQLAQHTEAGAGSPPPSDPKLD